VRTKSGSIDVKYKYTGQEEDPETGLYYYNARYYDPILGRFISADSIVGNPRDPQDLNRYTYANNNPLKYTDPTGHKSFWKKIFGVVEMIVGAVLTAYQIPVGPALMAHGAYNLGANVDARAQTQVASWDSRGVTYTGPGSTVVAGSNRNTSSASYYSNPYSDVSGRYSGWNNVATVNLNTAYRKYYGSVGLDFVDFDFYINPYYAGFGERGRIDWFDVTLAGISSTSAVVALGAPPTPVGLQVKGVAAGLGTFSTGGSLIYTGYKWYKGEISDKDAAIKAALDVAPFFGKGAGKAVGKWINPDAGRSIDAAVDVLEHQKGLLDAWKGIFYDPSQ